MSACATRPRDSRKIHARLKFLSEEFESLGIENINVNVDVMEQLMESVYKLIKLYRRALKKHNELLEREAILRNENAEQQKALLEYREQLDEKELQVSELEEEAASKRSENQELRLKMEKIPRGIDFMKNMFKIKYNELRDEVKRLTSENNDLLIKLGEHRGKITTGQELTQQMANRFRERETAYREKIRKLKCSNISLMEEVMSIKDETSTTNS